MLGERTRLGWDWQSQTKCLRNTEWLPCATFAITAQTGELGCKVGWGRPVPGLRSLPSSFHTRLIAASSCQNSIFPHSVQNCLSISRGVNCFLKLMQPDVIRQRGTGLGGQSYYYISFLNYSSQPHGQLLPDDLMFCSLVSTWKSAALKKSVTFWLSRSSIFRIWVSQKKKKRSFREETDFVLGFLFVYFLLSFSPYAIRDHSGPTADLASEMLEPLFPKFLECIRRNNMRCTQGETLKNLCLVRHIVAMRQSPLPRSLPGQCLWPSRCSLTRLVCCSLKCDSPALSACVGPVLCADGGLLDSGTALFLFVFSDWAGHWFPSPEPSCLGGFPGTGVCWR